MAVKAHSFGGHVLYLHEVSGFAIAIMRHLLRQQPFVGWAVPGKTGTKRANNVLVESNGNFGNATSSQGCGCCLNSRRSAAICSRMSKNTCEWID